MKKNYRFLIAYDGTRYYGWEHKPTTELTIQGKLQSVLSVLAGEEVKVIGAGRTDAGVHAQGMVANAHFDTGLAPDEIRDYMNHYLPEDICVREVMIMPERFHSRYHAVGKTYRYSCYIGDRKPVFDRKYVYTPPKKPDVSRMQTAAQNLIGQHDFASFCSNSKMKKSTVRTVDRIDIVSDGEYLQFSFHGDGFLQHMIRILTGTLLEIGWGERSVDCIPEILAGKKRALAGYTVPSRGLCLITVDYED